MNKSENFLKPLYVQSWSAESGSVQFPILCICYVSDSASSLIFHQSNIQHGQELNQNFAHTYSCLLDLSQYGQACFRTAEAPAVWGAARIWCNSLVEGGRQDLVYQGETKCPSAHTSHANPCTSVHRFILWRTKRQMPLKLFTCKLCVEKVCTGIFLMFVPV